MTKENLNDNLIVIRTFYEIILNLLNKLEYPSKLILLLLRADGNETLNRINESYHIFKENHPNCEEVWENYFSLYDNLCKILDKFKTAAISEGLSLKFSQDAEVYLIYIATKYYK